MWRGLEVGVYRERMLLGDLPDFWHDRSLMDVKTMEEKLLGIGHITLEIA